MSKFLDLSGRTFYRWTVISSDPSQTCRPSQRKWLCRCECGTERETRARFLVHGLSRSCGCLNRELIVAKVSTHKMYKTPEHMAWLNMKARCCNPKHPSFSHYGGRGVKVCDRWVVSFRDFYDDIGPRPTPAHSLDRIDNQGDYEPSNCRWATKMQQSGNTRRNKMVQYLGQEMCISQAARMAGLSVSTLRWRIKSGVEGELLFAPTKQSF